MPRRKSKKRKGNTKPAIRRTARQLPDSPGAEKKEYVQGKARARPKYRNTATDFYRRRDTLEPPEIPIRSPSLAQELIDIYENCPEVALAIETIVEDIFSSSDGNDRGFCVGETLEDGTPVKTEVLDILKPFIKSVIGGRKLQRSPERFLAYGDAFVNIVFDPDITEIVRVMYLPTWEMFRKEDEVGNIQYFEQKFDTYSEGIVLHPVTVVHWRHRPKYLYGRAITREILPDWSDLKEFKWDHRLASRAVGTNSKVHVMPKGTNDKFKSDYILDNEDRMENGAITDYYMGGHEGGGDIKMLRNTDPNLESLINSEESRRRIIITRMGLPAYVAGLKDLSGGKDLMGQPAMAYARKVNAYRGEFAEGIIQLCNTQLALKGIDPREKENAYPIIFPKIYINQMMADADKAQEQETAGKQKDSDKVANKQDQLEQLQQLRNSQQDEELQQLQRVQQLVAMESMFTGC